MTSPSHDESTGSEGPGQPDPSRSVFINCPLDDAYSDLFNAILFATVCCGFLPRSSLETGTVAEPRLARVARAILTSRHSIHDLSRCTGEGSENLARFNMPLELGMAMARRWMDPESEHDWLVLVPEGHTYVRFISDLAGHDPHTHDGTVHGVTVAVMAWLATRERTKLSVEPNRVLSAYPKFQKNRQALETTWRGYPPWHMIVSAAVQAAKTIG